MKKMVTKLGAKQRSVTVYYNKKSAIDLGKNETHHKRTKHMDVKLHFVRLEVAKGGVKLLKIQT